MKVIFALDESKYSSFALDYLQQLPFSRSVDLVLATIEPMIVSYDYSGTGYIPDVTPLILKQRESIQASLNQKAAFSRDCFSTVETRTAVGSVGHELVQMGTDTRAELIALGAVGHSALSRIVLGSTSDYVATHAECSAMVIRPIGDTKPDSAGMISTPKNILVAIGHAESDHRLVSWIERIALPESTQVHLVHVMQLDRFSEQDLLTKASAYWRAVHSAASRHMDQMQLKLQSIGYDVQTRLLEESHVGRAITDYAETETCGLVITGDRRESLIGRFFMGSTSRHVLRHARCSVLISREMRSA